MGNDLKEIIAANVKHYRLEAELTQEQLAEKIRELDPEDGRTASAIARIEQALVIPGADTLKWIAEVLGVSTDDLLSDD